MDNEPLYEKFALFIEQGCNLKKIQTLLGHATINMTKWSSPGFVDS